MSQEETKGQKKKNLWVSNFLSFNYSSWEEEEKREMKKERRKEEKKASH